MQHAVLRARTVLIASLPRCRGGPFRDQGQVGPGDRTLLRASLTRSGRSSHQSPFHADAAGSHETRGKGEQEGAEHQVDECVDGEQPGVTHRAPLRLPNVLRMSAAQALRHDSSLAVSARHAC